MTIIDYYNLPGIDGDRTLSCEEISKILKEKYLEFHPDKRGQRNQKETEEEKTEKDKIFNLIVAARKILTDEYQRNKYDWGLAVDEPDFFYLEQEEITTSLPGGWETITQIISTPKHRNQESASFLTQLTDPEFIGRNIRIVEKELARNGFFEPSNPFNFALLEELIKYSRRPEEDGKIKSKKDREYTAEQLRDWKKMYADLKNKWFFKASRTDFIKLTDDLLSIIYQATQNRLEAGGEAKNYNSTYGKREMYQSGSEPEQKKKNEK